MHGTGEGSANRGEHEAVGWMGHWTRTTIIITIAIVYFWSTNAHFLSLQLESWLNLSWEASKVSLQTFSEGCCIHFLLLSNKSLQTLQLKTTPIYHLTVLAVESLGRLNWVLSEGFHQAAVKVSLRLGSHLGPLGKICFQVLPGC